MALKEDYFHLAEEKGTQSNHDSHDEEKSEADCHCDDQHILEGRFFKDLFCMESVVKGNVSKLVMQVPPPI